MSLSGITQSCRTPTALSNLKTPKQGTLDVPSPLLASFKRGGKTRKQLLKANLEVQNTLKTFTLWEQHFPKVNRPTYTETSLRDHTAVLKKCINLQS